MNLVVQRIDELRRQKGISQNELAKMINVSANAVYHWSKTDTMPTLANIERICEVLDITIEQFFHGISISKSGSDKPDFLSEWRSLSPEEKAAVRKVMQVFISNREERR